MTAPVVTISESALRAFRQAAADMGEGEVVRLTIDASFHNDLYFATPEPNDILVVVEGLTLAMDPRSARRADGVRIDYVEGPSATGFKLDNPNSSSDIQGVCPADVVRMLAEDKRVLLLDARSEAERGKAQVAAARPLEACEAELADPKSKLKLVFLGHHSTDGRAAARPFHGRGFKELWYVVGGIDGWSTMDPSIPRY